MCPFCGYALAKADAERDARIVKIGPIALRPLAKKKDDDMTVTTTTTTRAMTMAMTTTTTTTTITLTSVLYVLPKLQRGSAAMA